MAVAHPPLAETERNMSSQAQNAISIEAVEAKQSPASPVLIVLLLGMAAFPFFVGYLPDGVRQYLGALFR